MTCRQQSTRPSVWLAHALLKDWSQAWLTHAAAGLADPCSRGPGWPMLPRAALTYFRNRGLNAITFNRVNAITRHNLGGWGAIG